MANITGRVAVCHVFGAGVIYLSGQQTSAKRPGYLLDVTARQGEVDMRNRGLELTRRSRAQALDDLLHVRRRAAAARGSDVGGGHAGVIRQRDQGCDRRCQPAARRCGDGPDQRRLRLADGYVTTRRSVLLLCMLNPRTTEDEPGERSADWLLTPAWTKGEAPNDGRWRLAGRRSAPSGPPTRRQQPALPTSRAVGRSAMPPKTGNSQGP
jgi:hypothetical protein